MRIYALEVLNAAEAAGYALTVWSEDDSPDYRGPSAAEAWAAVSALDGGGTVHLTKPGARTEAMRCAAPGDLEPDETVIDYSPPEGFIHAQWNRVNALAERSIEREALIEGTRAAVLAALDASAAELFAGSPMLGRDAGASDLDLPALFAVLDAHALKLADRFGFTVEG